MQASRPLAILVFILLALLLPLRAQFVSRLGETRANTFTSGHQYPGNAAMDADGDFVVVWTSLGQDGSEYGIYAQRYNAAGAPQGGEFRVNTATANHQWTPAVAMDADGDFVVVWESLGQDGDDYGIYAQRYNATGVAQGGEFRVNTVTAGTQYYPAVAMDADGDFVVVWTGVAPVGGDHDIYAQRYDAAGAPQGGEFRVNTHVSTQQEHPAVAMAASGAFVVTWQSLDQDGSGTGIYAQRYTAAGEGEMGGEFRINTTRANYQEIPSVAMDAHGGFVVAWQSADQDGSGTSVHAQRINAVGAAEGGEFRVNTTTAGNQLAPLVAMAADGDFVVTWMSEGQDGSGQGVYAQSYAAAGTPRGGEFRANTTTAGHQLTGQGQVAMDAAGHFVIPWYSENQDGSGLGVYFDKFFVDITTEPPLLTAPADGTATGSPIAVSYMLPEAALAGSVQLKFQDATQGVEVFITPDAAGHAAGPHTRNIIAAAPGTSAGVAASTGGAIVSGTYSVTVSYRDALGNAVASDSSLNVAIDAMGPAGGTFAVTPPSPMPYDTVLTGSFAGWSDPNGPLTYAIRTGAAAEVTVVPPGAEPEPEFTLLPGTHTVTGRVTDGRGNFTDVTTTVTVLPPEVVVTPLYTKGSGVPGAGVDPRIAAGAVWTGFGVPAINDDGNVAFLGQWEGPAGIGSGIFVDDTLVIAAGEPAPDLPGVTLRAFKDPALTADDKVVFLAKLAGPGVVGTNNKALFGNTGASLRLIARNGFPAPGLLGARLTSIRSFAIGGLDTYFTASLRFGTGGVTSANDMVLWRAAGSTTEVLVRKGSDVGGVFGKSVKTFAALLPGNGSPGHGRGSGDAAFTLVRATFHDGTQAVREVGPSAAALPLFTSGDAAPTLSGVTMSKFGLAATNGSDSATRTTLAGTGVTGANNQAIVTSGGALVLRKGDDAPGPAGSVISGLKDPVYNAQGHVATPATLAGKGGTRSAILWHDGTTANLVARTGDPAADLTEGETWKAFRSVALSDGLGPIFVATLTQGVAGVTSANDTGLWTQTSLGTLRLALREGAIVDGRTVKTFKVLGAVSSSPDQRRAFNSQRQVVAVVNFADGTSSLVRIDVP